MIAIIAFVIALIGLLLYAFAGNSKLQEVGRIMFFCGMFFITQQLAGKTIKLF